MSILNQKEEVIKVEMTSYGRKIYGLGLYKPSYFSFFDDSIIYDTLYSGLDENTNNIENRILNYDLTFSGLNLLSVKKDEELGASDTMSEYAPAWSIDVLRGKMTYLPEESSYYKKKFSFKHIDCFISFDNYTAKEKNVIIENDYILIDLSEYNVGDDSTNFDVELLYYDPLTSGSNGVIEKKLVFLSPKTNIINDIIYDEQELPSTFYDVNINKDYAAYYFDLLVDNEIDTDYFINSSKNTYEIVRGFITSPQRFIPIGAGGGRNGGNGGGPPAGVDETGRPLREINRGPPGETGDRVYNDLNGEPTNYDKVFVEYDGDLCRICCS